MQKVPITLAAPGMVLAKPIVNEKGMPLCAEGTELTDTLIDRLRAMNITVLAIKGHPLGGDVKTIDEKVQDIEERFLPVKGDPIMDRVKAAIISAIRQEDDEIRAMEDKEGAPA